MIYEMAKKMKLMHGIKENIYSGSAFLMPLLK